MDNRPGLSEALDDVCRQRAVLVVQSLSRLSRSVRDTLTISERLDKAGANLASLSESIDTTGVRRPRRRFPASPGALFGARKPLLECGAHGAAFPRPQVPSPARVSPFWSAAPTCGRYRRWWRRSSAGGRVKAAPWAPTLQSGLRPAGVVGGGDGDLALEGDGKRRRGRRHSKVGFDRSALSAVETAIVRARGV
jgi:hypothetical protein